MSKSNGSTPTYFVNDEGGTPILSFDSSGNVQAMNGFGPTGWVARDYPSGSDLGQYGYVGDYSYTYDPEGNLVQRHPAIAGASALDTTVYDPYGNFAAYATAAAGPVDGQIVPFDPVGFGGEYGYYTDKETGKSLLGHRYYDSVYGRFLNRDPIGYNGGINLYEFAGNNPITHSDPSGFDTSDDESQEEEDLSLERALLKEEEAERQASEANRTLTEQDEVEQYGVSKELLVERDEGTPSEREDASEIVARTEGRVGSNGEAPLWTT